MNSEISVIVYNCDCDCWLTLSRWEIVIILCPGPDTIWTWIRRRNTVEQSQLASRDTTENLDTQSLSSLVAYRYHEWGTQTRLVSVPSNDHHSLRITSSAASTNRILTYSAGRGWDIPTFEADTSQCNPSRHIFLFLVPSLLIQTQLKSCWRWAPDFLECVMCRGGPPVGPSE